jgi:NAD+ diphosphatase
MQHFEGELGRMLLARSVVDRAAEHRTDAEWQATAWADPATRVFVVYDSRAEAVLEPLPALVFRSGPETDALHPDADRYFLGVDEDGVAYYAVSTPPPEVDGPIDVPASPMRHLREIAGVLGDRDGGLLAHAIGLEHWHRAHHFCGVCGAPTVITHSGSVRKCTGCGIEHFPRTDPAVIMAVTDADDRLLLARNSSWPQNRASVLAGFVEPGETLEAAVAREVLEEAGLTVTSVQYKGSQPWPLPRSLMLGFTATVASPELHLDGAELDWAKWYTRAELKEAVSTGELLMLPSEISISRRLINHWYGSDPAEGSDW